MISVITPTVRNDGILIVERALNRQTFKDYEWIVQGQDRKPNSDEVWTLNHDMNVAIKKAKGDLIVSWQDNTYSDPTTLEKFWKHYIDEPNTLVTAVGNKYTDDSFTVMTWKDPRERNDIGTYYDCFFNDIEFNLCSIPKKAIYSVGGYDESLDQYYGMDGFSIVDRLNIHGGWNFKIDQTIKSYSLEHGRPAKWEELNAIHGPYEFKRQSYVDNPTLTYLS